MKLPSRYYLDASGHQAATSKHVEPMPFQIKLTLKMKKVILKTTTKNKHRAEIELMSFSL